MDLISARSATSNSVIPILCKSGANIANSPRVWNSTFLGRDGRISKAAAATGENIPVIFKSPPAEPGLRHAFAIVPRSIGGRFDISFELYIVQGRDIVSFLEANMSISDDVCSDSSIPLSIRE